MKKIIIPVSALLLLAGCGGNKETSSSESAAQTADSTEQLEVFTTVYPLAYFTEEIGGNYVNVQSIYPPGSNEHTFEPTQKDMIALAEADALFYIGLELEGFVDNAKETLKNENVEFIATSESISESDLGEGHSHGHETEEHDHEQEEATEEHNHDHEHTEETEEHSHAHEEEIGEHGHAHDTVDPHIWISPVLSQKLAETIKNELVERDEEHAAEYEGNYEKLVAELEELDQSFKTVAENADQKSFFVSHEAFGYIANTYGFDQVAVAGLNSEDEPSQKELTQIVELAKEKDIHYIAFEQNVSSKIAEVIQNEIGAEAVHMHNLSVLTQEDIEQGETYFTLMEKNLAVFEKILN
ncbi:metal ABC transporter solute-binding protein, Zn/Mn family [Planococcus sp. YIM B11945]|uniref:metal ABC transporter solute-binding protein, Zn/Mn family n=1 Tax=Planococcus sp. YIM B11945 TaxID=3435410 RepID=UPI003D7D0F28